MTGEKKEFEHDRRENDVVIAGFSFPIVIPVLDTGICKGDPRDKPEDDRREKSPRMTVIKRR